MAEAKNSVPLYLSKYLSDGRIKEAQEESRVSLPHSSVDIQSHSGYITVNKARGDHLFIWYFPKEQKCENGGKIPLVIWLNGGPGYSSLLGLFEEIGPFVVDENNKVSRRDLTWTDHFSLLCIDNPVGVGFSYRETSYKESMSTSDIADNLYECLVQFFEIFPDVKAKDVYIGGQSYGGKYATPLAYRVHTATNSDIRLKGIYIASGLMSPKKMIPLNHKGLVNLGVISNHSGELMQASVLEGLEKIKSNPEKGMEKILESIFGYMEEVKGYGTVDNMISTQDYNWTFASYANLPEVQQAIHAKPCEFKIMNDDTVMQLAYDFLSGTSHDMSVLLEHYRVLLFNGQMDPVVNIPMTDAFLSNLQWSGHEEFVQSGKRVWKDTAGKAAGYVTVVKNMTWMVISRAGHRLAIDQPKQVLDMMKQFIQGVQF